MSHLKELFIFKQEGIDESLVYVDQLFTFFRNRLLPSDKGKLRKDNLIREFKGHRDGIKELEQGPAVTTVSVLKYIFHHLDDFNICHDIAVDVQNFVFDSKSTDYTKTLFGLYNCIASADLHLTSVHFYDNVNINDIDIPTLHQDYKSNFPDNLWKKICLFENHYSVHTATESEDFESSVKKKWELFTYLQNTVEMSEKWTSHTKSLIKHRIARQKSYEKEQSIEICIAGQTHYPAVIEGQILKKLKIVCCDINDAVCVDLGVNVAENNALLVFLFCSEIEKCQDISDYVNHFLKTEHHVNIQSIYFISQEHILSSYKNQKDNEIARFLLRDDILQGKLQEHVLHIEQPHNESFPLFEDENCPSCFGTALLRPLSLDSFSTLQEWCLDVPLDIQIFMESFINSESVRKSNDQVSFVLSKLERLYGVYDVLLNTYNKNYFGVIQQANTEELAMHFHSVNTVFAITSNTGISSSLITAEKKIKERADNDLCYYNTYLKKFPLKYSTNAGDMEQKVSLRDCHLILMMDNLVRLTFQSDPDPGESRSGQICTLPLTIQGLPKDNIVTELWHDPTNCNNKPNCGCKRSITLSKADFERVLIHPTEDEQGCWDRFTKLCMWGHASLWRQFRNTNLQNLVLQPTTNVRDVGIMQEEFEMSSDLSDVEIEEDDEYSSVESHTDNCGVTLEDVSPEREDQEEDDLEALLKSAESLTCTEDEYGEISGIFNLSKEQSLLEVERMEQSFSKMSFDLEEEESEDSTIKSSEGNHDVLGCFGFAKYKVPPLLCRHPPPAIGRDDDICKLREILDDVIIKTGRIRKNVQEVDRILFGPDNKIGANLLQVIKETKYQHFLPEFPLLHLRKSKINTLFSAYKTSGLLQILMFMCDDEKKEWKKLLSMEHIDVATKYVRRLSVSFHVAFLCRFLQTLESHEADSIVSMLEKSQFTQVMELWNHRYVNFMKTGSLQNATFSLHADMMQHCDEVIAVYLSERLGGTDGYNLLLSAVKSSLLFSFLNGATSYGPYCAKLLIQHYSCGYFHQHMKSTLYTTPIGNSSTNFSGDSKREMDHQDALRGFRAGSNISSVTNRMSLIDSLSAVHQQRSSERIGSRKILNQEEADDRFIDWKLSETDLNHILPTVALILRQGGLSMAEEETPTNVYTSEKVPLSPAILDKASFGVGEFLLKKFLVINNLMGFKSEDLPDTESVVGPVSLLNRAKKSKGVTLKRTTEKTTIVIKSERQIKEESRKKLVKREQKMADFLSSEMNMCQALVKPDCTKPKVMKSKGIQKAILSLLKKMDCNQDDLVKLNTSQMPTSMSKTVELVTVEFAGVKFKTKVASGTQYIKYVQNSIIKPILQQLPQTKRVIICEEKYSFTPDSFKAATHQQRASKKKSTIAHLRLPETILNPTTFRKDDIITTREGKILVSKYLAENAMDLQLDADIILDIDSEYNMNINPCDHGHECNCQCFAVPMRCTFKKCQPSLQIEKYLPTKQRKGEAEMAQVDWLLQEENQIAKSAAVCSLVTSGDIDAVTIHLFALSQNWSKLENEKFKVQVYVVLQKPQRKMDIYNITGILEVLEKHFKDDASIGKKIALVLCMGGNDFIPKYYNISHEKMLNMFLNSQYFQAHLFKSTHEQAFSLDAAVYKQFMKHIYCPKSLDAMSSISTVRNATIYCKRKRLQEDKIVSLPCIRNAQLWMPPESAFDRMADIINFQIYYLATAGSPMAILPDFLSKDCLKRTDTGDIEYYFGPDAKENIETIKIQQKRSLDETPQKGHRKKRQMVTSTPTKHKK